MADIQCKVQLLLTVLHFLLNDSQLNKKVPPLWFHFATSIKRAVASRGGQTF